MRLVDELDKFINTQQTIITSYLDTYELTPMNKFRVLSVLLDAKVKNHEMKKRYLLQSIQSLKIQRDVFIKQSKHDEHVEIAFMNDDYNEIIELWCDKFDKSYNSLDKLFLVFQFFLEDRTINFIKKHSEKDCIFNHMDCMYSIQIITSQSLHDKNFPMYKNELSNIEYITKLKRLLWETKNTFRQFILHVYRKYLPMLPCVIFEKIIDYNYLDYGNEFKLCDDKP